MRRLFIALAFALAPGAAAAQRADTAAARAWNSPRAIDLVARAAERRRTQLADTALHDYRALAKGYLAFVGQLGDIEIPRVLMATQIATEVYWRTPNVSKQRVIGERDTTLLPTDNEFYRDRFGIVQNNFPDVIRVGEGRDVADVPHPLSPSGPQLYDFAVRDSLRIRTAAGTIGVIELQVRPKDQSAPRFVGSLFVDRDAAQVVRMAFTFTRSAYLDERNDEVSIVLENALVQGRFWLPRHQAVEVRRSGTWLDFPAKGIIRGRWEIGEYAVNVDLPPQTFAGPAMEFLPPAQRRAYPFAGRIVDSLPADVRMVTDEDVRRVQAQARALVQRQVLARARGSALSARNVSDFVRANRVEGVAVGAGWLARLGGGMSVSVRGRYGIDDERGKGRLALQREWPDGTMLRASAFDDFREAGDEPEVSTVRNSLAAQEFGSDWTDPYRARGLALGVDAPPRWFGVRPSIELSWERQSALSVNASPFNGRFERTIPARELDALRLSLGAERPTSPGPLGAEWGGTARLRLARWGDPGHALACGADARCGRLARLALALRAERPFGDARLVSHTTFGVVGGHEKNAPNVGPDTVARPAVAPQDYVYLGGPVTGPGYAFHSLAGRIAGSQRLEWRVPVPFPSIPLGPYGRSPATATLAPYAHVAYVARPAPFQARRLGWYPAVGLGAYTFFDLLRFDVARGMRDGRWTFSVDVAREFWRIL